jgi:hypothetical protein
MLGIGPWLMTFERHQIRNLYFVDGRDGPGASYKPRIRPKDTEMRDAEMRFLLIT